MSSGSTDLFATLPNSGWATSGKVWVKVGDNSPATCVRYVSDSKYIRKYNDTGDYHGSFNTYGYSAVPAYMTITTLRSYIFWKKSAAGAESIKIRVGRSGVGWVYSGALGLTTSYAWKYFDAPRPGGGSWVRTDLAGLLASHRIETLNNNQYHYGDCHLVRVYWTYFNQTGHDITSFTGIDTEGATANMKYNAGGDGLTDYYVEWGDAPSTYQHNTGWIRTGLSGTGWQYPTKHITGEAPGAMVYVRFRTRNCGDTDVVYCPEHSFRTLGGVSVTGCLVS